MREYWVKRGKFEGIHNIYDNPEEYYKYFPDHKLKRWSKDLITDMKVGEYIRADDDFVVPIIGITPRVNARNRITYFVNFPMVTVYAFEKLDKTWTHQNLYAFFSYPNKDKLKHSIDDLRDIKNDKLLKFALLLATDYPIIPAYKLAFGVEKKLNIKKLIYIVHQLLEIEIVRNSLMKQLEEVQDKLRGKITLDDFVEKVVGHWNNVEQGTTQELNAIREIGRMIGYVAPKTGSQVEVPSKSIPDADDAQIVEEKTDPNALPQATND